MVATDQDIVNFELLKCSPNFITSRRVIGNVIFLNDMKEKKDLSGKIVIIESADPGYDWIFGQGIAGLIIKYASLE